ncbi:SPFH domain-containing protein [Vibrio salinus]|uniref:SPFH domain-containing protein n=1 Tax=Vibrio salinus TaxID=2899784 RepID=UPI001E4492BC|nr:SPFH domain-containing protein [Vibrio salinus]MCE0494713.1 paraslipin [Vibrio salinus]
MDYISSSLVTTIVIVVFFVLLLRMAFIIVPQQHAYVVERLGKYSRTLNSGLNIIIPVLDKIAYRHSLKEIPRDTAAQTVITKDNISVTVDGIVYYRVIDPKQASYGVENYEFAITKLAQTTLRSALGSRELDAIFEERDQLNSAVSEGVNQAAETWGVQLLRYEIKDINPPESVMAAMEQQMKAERQKRASILEAEGAKASEIAKSEGEKQSKILTAEGEARQITLEATAKAEAIRINAQAQAEAIRINAEAQAKQFAAIGEALNESNNQMAMSYDVTLKDIDAKKAIAKESSVIVLPDQGNGLASLLAQSKVVTDRIPKI